MECIQHDSTKHGGFTVPFFFTQVIVSIEGCQQASASDAWVNNEGDEEKVMT